MRFNKKHVAKLIKDKGLFDETPKPNPKKPPKPKTYVEVNFIRQFLDLSGLPYVCELQFAKHLKRRFKFDFAVPELKVAIEYEGINSGKSRHTSITGYSKDCEKYNLAVKLGWRVLRYTCMNYKDVSQDFEQIRNPQ